MAWGDVLVQSATLSPTTASTSHTVTLGATATAGNSLVILIASTSTVTTPPGWTQAPRTSIGTVKPTILYYDAIPGGISSVAITFASSERPRIAIYELTGCTVAGTAHWDNSTWNADPAYSGQVTATDSIEYACIAALTSGYNSGQHYTTWAGPDYGETTNRFTALVNLTTTVGIDPELHLASLYASGPDTFGTSSVSPGGGGGEYAPQGALIVYAVGPLPVSGTLAATLDGATMAASGSAISTFDGRYVRNDGTSRILLNDGTSALVGNGYTGGGSGASGTLAVTLTAATLAASGAETIPGALASTLAGATLTASGTETVTGTLTSSLAAATLAASGSETVAGTLATTLAGATLTGTGAEALSGILAATLAGASLAASGTETVTGTAATTLAGAGLAASGTVAPPVTGTLAATLSGAALAASGSSGTPPVTGTLTVALSGATLAGSGTETLTGALAATLAGAALAATGGETLTGTLTTGLTGATLAASGTAGPAPIVGTLAATLAPAALAASGSERMTGTLAATLDAVTLSASGVTAVTVTGVLSVTLASAALTASGSTAGGIPYRDVRVASVSAALGRPVTATPAGHAVTTTTTRRPVTTSASSGRPVTVAAGTRAVTIEEDSQ